MLKSAQERRGPHHASNGWVTAPEPQVYSGLLLAPCQCRKLLAHRLEEGYMTRSAASEFAFGRCVIQPAARRVLIGGQPAVIGARAFDVLLTLIERRERSVSKGELLDLVWPGVVVEENNLQVHISALRKLLGPQVIATIPGRGYRFTATLDGEAPGPAALAPPAALPLVGPSSAPSNLPLQLPPLSLPLLTIQLPGL